MSAPWHSIPPTSERWSALRPWIQQSRYFFVADDRIARLAAAEAALTKALSLAPENAFAHLCLGVVQTWTNRASQGIRECERALELDRNLANAHGQIGMAKVQLGQAKDTETHIQAALRLSPRDAFAYQWCSIAGRAKLYLGEEEAAIAWLRRSIETNRNYPMSHFFLAAALARLGLLPEACSEARTGACDQPDIQHPSTFRASKAERQSDCGRRTGAHH